MFPGDKRVRSRKIPGGAGLTLRREPHTMAVQLMKDFCHKGIVLEPSERRWAFLFPGGRKGVSQPIFPANLSGIISENLLATISVKGNSR
ncbi:MAG TPA: hypothetical protein VGT03_13895 [Candidatus Acidoferrales bacterium]|nr:hypothetical protein [Candidatus Acidoferrales bacterium]